MLLIGRQSIQAALAQYAVHGRRGHGHAMKALQVVRNLARTEVVVLPEVQHLADDLRRGRARCPTRRPRSVAQADRPVFLEPPRPFVEQLAREAEMSAGAATLRGA